MEKPNLSFTSRVQAIVANIPRGSVMTYRAVATAAGNPAAARAVARTMAANYDPSIPCHRVVRSDRSIGGYNRGGTVAKRDVLRTEGVSVDQRCMCIDDSQYYEVR